MKVTVVWQRPHTWWGWLIIPLYLAVCLLFLPLYLPAYLGLALSVPYQWLYEKCRAALWEQPLDRLKLLAWSVPATLLYLPMTPLYWYANKLTWVFSKLPFKGGPDPKGA